MPDVIKTIESWRDARRVREFLFEPPPSRCGRFLFNVGRGRPTQKITGLWFVFRGRVLGSFRDVQIADNSKGEFHEEYAMQYTPPYFAAARFLFLCRPPFSFLKARVFHQGFQGWRYFDFDRYAKSLDAKVRI